MKQSSRNAEGRTYPRAKKSLGQNFLINPHVNSSIVQRLGLSGDEVVIEIGPGTGLLTRRLSSKAFRVIAFEVDTRLRAIHESMQGEHPNLEFRYEDFLNADLAAIAEQYPEKQLIIAGNIPYHLTSPILFKLFDAPCPIHAVGLTVQKEVAERMVAECGGKDYSLLSVLVQYYFEPELKFLIFAKNFKPKPKVDSAFMVLKPRPERELAGKAEMRFRQVVKASFSHRRKKLFNSLLASGLLDLSKEEIGKLLDACGIDPNLRPQNLSVLDYVALTRMLL